MKHIPIPNKNELDDSKLEAVVQKWSENTATGAPSKESPVSSDEKPAAISQVNSTDDNNSNTASGSDGDTKHGDGEDDGGNSSQEDEDSKTEGKILRFLYIHFR